MNRLTLFAVIRAAQLLCALDAGLTPDEIRHAVLLGLTTIGLPSMMKTMAWVEDVLGEAQV